MVLALSQAIFGFGFIINLDIALAYCTDCYQDVSPEDDGDTTVLY